VKHRLRYSLLAVCCAAAQLNSCSAPRTGPKLIRADGVRYIACGGAVWVRNDGNEKDPSMMNYEIVFKDALGSSHHLTMVHTLTVTDLPDDAFRMRCFPIGWRLGSPLGGSVITGTMRTAAPPG
jgi:hypothetical protein